MITFSASRPVSAPSAQGSASNVSASAEVPTLPPARDVFTEMTCGSDFGTALAAFSFEADKNSRDAARTARDASYDAMDAANRDVLEQMKSSSQTKLWTGVVQGTLELGAAAATFKSAWSEPGSSGAIRLNALSTAGQASATLAGSIGKCKSDENDRNVTAAQQRADNFKRIAERHNDDVQDASNGMQKMMQFCDEWIGARSSERHAAVAKF